MRKLSSILLPVAAVGALVGSTLAVAGPAAAWDYGYGRYERHEHFDRDDRARDDRGWRGGDRFYESRGWRDGYRSYGSRDRRDGERAYGYGWGRRDGGYRYGGYRWR